MKIYNKITFTITVLCVVFAKAQITKDSLQATIKLKDKLIQANYQNINLKSPTNQSMSKNTSSASESMNDNYYDELGTLSGSQESNDIFRINQSENDLYTGKQMIKIPLFNIEQGGIKLPIMLVYNTSGIKVDQRASEVGLGWTLLAGPQINRKINMVNDWFQTNSFDPWPKPNGYFRKVRDNMPTVNNNYYVAESLPDEYFVNLNNSAKRFIFSNETTPLEISNTQIKIQSFNKNFPNFSVFQPKDFYQFKITDNDGLKYTFVDAGFKSSNTENMELNSYSSSSLGEWPSVSDWKVSQIEDVFNNSSITFQYLVNSNPKVYTSKSENSSTKCSQNSPFPYERCITMSSQYNSYKFYVNYTTEWISEKKYISEISFDAGKLVFNYDVETEAVGAYPTVSSNYVLKSIEQFDKSNKSIKKYTFSYSTFGCVPTQDDIDMCNPRLKLSSLYESNKGTYDFFYNNLPLYSYTSSKFDFLGYHTDSVLSDIEKGLYYYPGYKEWAILPYNLPIPPKTPDGQFEIQKIKLFNHDQTSVYKLKVLPSSNYAKAGILEKIKFPTGGEEVFSYELNDYVLLDKYEVQGSGLRIKETSIKDQSNTVKRTQYKYKDTATNKSSGLLLAPPFIGYPLQSFDLGNDFTEIMNEDEAAVSMYFSLYNKTNSNSDIINGSSVGYSHVTKIYDDNSYERFDFKNKNDNYDLETENYLYSSVFPGASEDFIYGDFKNKNSAALVRYKNFEFYGNGNLLEHHIFDKNNSRIKKTVNTYGSSSLLKWAANYPYFTPARHYTINDTNPPPPANPYGTPWTYGTYKIKYTINFNEIETSTTTNYFPDGEKSETSTFTYINDYSDKIKKITKSNGLMMERKYLFESIFPVGTAEYNLQSIYNNIYALQSEKSILDGKIIDNQFVKYDNFLVGSLTVPKPSEVYKETLSGAIDTNYKILSYDEKGNIIETISNGISTVTIWGYNNSLPIAKIVGATYNQVLPHINDIVIKSNQDINETAEQALLISLNQFRGNQIFRSLQITTYTYDPLIGMTSVTDSSGKIVYYKYNSKNKIEKVIDQNGNILKEYKYNFKQ